MNNNTGDVGEFEFIETLKAYSICRPEGIILGIGDDAAILEQQPGLHAVVSTDMLVEHVHFIFNSQTAYYLGRKSIAVNLSDMAAMGAEPREVFISLAKPGHVNISDLHEIYRGMRDMAHAHKVNILGGDTSSSRHDLVINVTVCGMAAPGALITRTGASPGDILLTTDYLGDARGGLKVLLDNKLPRDETDEYLWLKHLNPIPQVAEGRFFAQSGLVTAMLDLSDGLSSDVRHLAKGCDCGALIWEDALPLSPQLQTFAIREGLNPAELALSGGDDYTLLLTCKPANKARLMLEFVARFGRPLYAIGEMTATKGCYLRAGGKVSGLDATGWDHFR